MSNKDSGFLMVYRTFFDHFLWNEKREFSKAEAWIDLLRTARYDKGSNSDMVNGNVVEWQRGELLASVRFLKNRWNWNSTGKVTRFLKLLEKQNMIERKTEQGATVISICNYSTYNPLDNSNRTETEQRQNRDRTETEQRRGQNSKKVKKVKKEKNTPPTREEVEEYFSERGDMILSDIPLEAENFINHYSDQDWKNGSGKKIKSWKRQAATWNNKYLQFNEDRLKNNSNGKTKNLEIFGA